jgi:outer membrane cobalamin receptor
MESQLKKWSLGVFACCMFAGLCFLCPRQAMATDQEAFEVFTLGEIVVTADRLENQGLATVSKVRAEDIERLNASNLGETLELIPSVYFRQGRSKEGYYVTVRGFEQENVLILLDGIPIGVPYEGLLNLTDIPVQNIAEIRVIKGNASVLYGSNAMGGVINIITKKGATDPSLSLTYQLSDYETHHVSLTHGWKKGPFSYFMGVSKRKSDGYPLAETFTLHTDVLTSMDSSPSRPSTVPNDPIAQDSGRRDNSDYDKDSFTFSGSLEISENNDLGLSFEYYNNEYGVPPVPIYREHRRGFFYFPRYWRFSNWERYTVNLIDEARMTDAFRIKTRLFYDDYANTLEAYDDATYSSQDRLGPPSGSSDYDDYSAGFHIQAFWDAFSIHRLGFGFNFRKDLHKENFNHNPFDKFVSYTYSAALEDNIHLRDDLVLTLGASYDVFDKKEVDWADDSIDNEMGDDVDAFNPQIGILYNMSDAVRVHASVGRKTRFPTLRNLYSTGVIGPEGDPDLEEERTYNYEVGTSWQMSDEIGLEVSLFYSDTKNLFNFDNILGRFEQYGEARIAGLEASIGGEVGHGLTTSVGYSYLNTENQSQVVIDYDSHPSLVYTPDDLPYRPEHQIALDVSKRFDFGLGIHFNGSYISKRPYYEHADPNDSQALMAEKRWLAGYVLLNLKLQQQFTDKVQVYVTAENMLDEAYENMDMFPGRGRILWIGARIDI